MSGNEETRVSELAEAVVLAEPKDLQALGALHARFLGIGESFTGIHAGEVASLCARARAAIERIIMEEAKDPAAEWADVVRCAACLQALICEGREPGELDLPSGTRGAPPADAAHGSYGEEDVLDGDPALTADFVRESLEHLENADLVLMALDSGPADPEAVNALFRAFKKAPGIVGEIIQSGDDVNPSQLLSDKRVFFHAVKRHVQLEPVLENMNATLRRAEADLRAFIVWQDSAKTRTLLDWYEDCDILDGFAHRAVPAGYLKPGAPLPG